MIRNPCPVVLGEMESIQYMKIGSCSGEITQLWNANVKFKNHGEIQ